jgi:predicted nucleic acid-binding Zn ribbon protein
MSRLAPRSLSVAISDFTDGLAPASTLGRVQQVWERTVGSAIALAARPTAERNGVLTVTCEASVWAQELHLIADQLVASLNAALGTAEIRELRCRTGPGAARSR